MNPSSPMHRHTQPHSHQTGRLQSPEALKTRTRAAMLAGSPHPPPRGNVERGMWNVPGAKVRRGGWEGRVVVVVVGKKRAGPGPCPCPIELTHLPMIHQGIFRGGLLGGGEGSSCASMEECGGGLACPKVAQVAQVVAGRAGHLGCLGMYEIPRGSPRWGASDDERLPHMHPLFFIHTTKHMVQQTQAP